MRTEAIVESFEASLREAFQQLQGGANAIPWWERKSLAQGMTESFVVGTASETAFLLVASIVHDLRSIMTHLKVNCYSLIEEVIADAGSQAKRYGVRVRNDLQLLESSVEDMVTFTRPVPTERLPESLGCSQATAKRELDILRSTGAIEFIGPSKTGGYQLRLVMSE